MGPIMKGLSTLIDLHFNGIIVHFRKGIAEFSCPSHTRLCFVWSFIVWHKFGVSGIGSPYSTHLRIRGFNVFQLLTRSHWNFLTCFNYSVISVLVSIQAHLSIFLSWTELVWLGRVLLIPFQMWEEKTDQSNTIKVLIDESTSCQRETWRGLDRAYFPCTGDGEFHHL